MDGDDDNPRDDEEGGEVVQFPGGRHPSQWPGDRPPNSDDAGATSLPFDDDQAAGQYEPLPEPSLAGRTYDLGARRRDDRAVDPGEAPETSEEAKADESAEIHDKLIDVVGDDEEFEDFVTGASSFDEFTRDDYIKATTQEYQGLAEAIAEAAGQQVEMQAVAAAMPGIDSGLVGFEDVTGEEPVMVAPVVRGPSDLTMRIVTGLTLVLALIGAVVLGEIWTWLFVLGATMVALGEFYATVRRQGFVPITLFGLLGGLATFGAAYLAVGNTPLAIAGAIGMTLVATTFWYAVVPRRNPLANASLTVFGMAWVAGLMAFAVPIVMAPLYQELVVALALVTGLFDVGSYFTGRTIGRTKMARVLSPKKTVEGLFGGIVVALAAGAGISYVDWFGFEPREGLLLGVVIAVTAPLGDLAESMIKRALNTKDMGAILPGHGGLLDRIDSFIFTVPACYVLFLWLGFLA